MTQEQGWGARSHSQPARASPKSHRLAADATVSIEVMRQGTCYRCLWSMSTLLFDGDYENTQLLSSVVSGPQFRLSAC